MAKSMLTALCTEYVADFDAAFVFANNSSVPSCGDADVERMNAFFDKWSYLATSEELGSVAHMRLVGHEYYQLSVVRVYGAWRMLRERMLVKLERCL
jgi:hypothetical protein